MLSPLWLTVTSPHQMQVQPSEAGVGSVLHRELDEEFDRMLVTFRCSVVVSTRIRFGPVALCCFGIFLLVLHP